MTDSFNYNLLKKQITIVTLKLLKHKRSWNDAHSEKCGKFSVNITAKYSKHVF